MSVCTLHTLYEVSFLCMERVFGFSCRKTSARGWGDEIRPATASVY